MSADAKIIPAYSSRGGIGLQKGEMAMLKTVLLLGMLFFLLWLPRLPPRPGWRLVLGAVCGLCGLLILNLLSPLTGMLFELNILTAGIAGFLGLPGVGLLLVAHCVLA